MKSHSPSRATRLLSVLLIAAIGATFWAYSRHQSAVAAAVAAGSDAESCQRDLADMAPQLGSDPSGVAVSDDAAAENPADPELNGEIRSAATVAGIPDEVVSIEPGVPRRLGETGFNETLVSLRLNTITLRQLITFLHQLSSRDPAVRAKILELAPPGGQVARRSTAGDGPSAKAFPKEESWSADITLAYLSFLPRDTGAK